MHSQIAECIRGSAKACHTSCVHGKGANFGLSMEGWRSVVRQAWVMGLLERHIRIGKGHNLVTKMVYSSYTISESGSMFLQNPHELMLPSVQVRKHTSSSLDAEDAPEPKA